MLPSHVLPSRLSGTLGHNVEVVRNHQTEESVSVELRDGWKAHSFSERVF